MLWWLLVLVSALCMTAQDIIKKSILTKEHAHVVATARSIAIGFMALFIFPFIKADVSVEALFYLYLASLLTCFAVLYSTKALKHLEISVMAPLDNLGPAFILVFAFLLLHEMPTSTKLFGILLLIVGAYLIEVRPGEKTLLGPLKTFFTSRYIHYFLFALIIMAGIATFEKYAMSGLFTPATYLFFFYIFFMVNFTILHWYSYGLSELKEEFIMYGRQYFLGAVFTVIAGASYLLALVAAPLTLVVSLRRVSTLFTTIIGGRFFKEGLSGLKIIACIIMLVGGYLLLR